MRSTTILFSIFFAMVLLTSCDKKDSGGTTTVTSMVGTKTYTGTPTANPFTVNCPEITDLSKQVVEVYVSSGTKLTPLPVTYAVSIGSPSVSVIVSHSYSIDGQNISIKTVQPTTSVALKDPNGSQNNYRIEIKSFAAAPHKAAYLNRYRLDKTSYNELIYGKEIVR